MLSFPQYLALYKFGLEKLAGPISASYLNSTRKALTNAVDPMQKKINRIAKPSIGKSMGGGGSGTDMFGNITK